MKISVYESKDQMGARAEEEGAERIRGVLSEKTPATVVLATGASQFEMLGHLVEEEVDWSRVEAFHLDEYIDLPLSHPASFRKYLKERFVDRLPEEIGTFHYIDGERDPQEECQRLNALLRDRTIDVAFVGIGENGHLAFNDPPADFETEDPFIVVELDEDCRRQQMGEGWFERIEEVPRRAISMSIQQIMRSETIVCTVPDARKAEAVRRTLEDPISPEIPASILREHTDCHLFLDTESASGLEKKPDAYDG
jgi:glucosamine-6-phosphate deaminase